jgi:hypothetical protein
MLFILFVIVYCFIFLVAKYCLSIERDNHEMHKQGICIECIENCYMKTYWGKHVSKRFCTSVCLKQCTLLIHIILMYVENSLFIKQVNEFSLIAKNIYMLQYAYLNMFSFASTTKIYNIDIYTFCCFDVCCDAIYFICHCIQSDKS